MTQLRGPETGRCPTYALATALVGGNAMLLSAGQDGALRSWDVRKMTQSSAMAAHNAPVRALHVVDGGVWSGATDGTVRCWELAQLHTHGN